ncbi:tRNA (adenine(58)-N(1))-methyltransferase catalytic subunit TRM61 [Cryptococcus gattii E566]|uniref:tRNA (adenine(58)-N(1))-methyltransferase catalytic subunit TRM61 n=2 Tax=Cryptococcus gattii TaxID=37769 RepID=E6RES8_CRYGW|nr:Subunit of tRNA (1-methyladenosine) methyltransferase, putative; Gcd14p [Cryptococcus gattii WM276]ADV25205.1 Subunit of tRNA (1-methyladenosine) methyltransferase, putative; Gcd14p [Cryptococcus gattii WM276]KIR76741.1 tRNA (adenine(58)-N(1))-methyltransferase catalytic subunit TRM61 [Cryptococcus gattii EJB2]KIY31600.1 tRNA (adenine(58)-N(1))-methyltransferase catalytic subunit TRM61 [Cryptococcus gattii E566]KJD99602.1 tRNA (adenine(58)-N(1))-methyltransferase catalytic subunit TRM61 [Cry
MDAQKPMLHSRAHIEAGDIVILYMARDNMTAITIVPGETFHNKYGRYPHDMLIGQKYGSKVHSPPPHPGYVHVLRPTPELWTLSLPHRTQILYLPDISYITMRLGVRVGGKVIEAGTGSGSMTHSLSRSVGPNGQVMSFEYHRQRFETALKEFESHGLTNVRLQHRNVCKEGFGDAQGVEGVFLDLPAPWEAIPHAVKALRRDIITRICCFSPCLEQVLKTVTCLRSEGFSDISTQEVLIRTHELVAPPPNTAYLSSISSVVSYLREHEQRKEERRLLQIKTAKENNRKVKGIEANDALPVEGETGTKRKLEQTSVSGPDNAAPADPHPKTNLLWTEPSNPFPTTVLTKPSPEMKGHTSYLTFAVLYPESVRLSMAAQETSSRVETPTNITKAPKTHSQETRYSEGSEIEKIGAMTSKEMDDWMKSGSTSLSV